MALKKYRVVRAVSYGTFAEKDERLVIVKTDVRRYEAGELIELPPEAAKRLLAEGAIAELDAVVETPKAEVPKTEPPKAGK